MCIYIYIYIHYISHYIYIYHYHFITIIITLIIIIIYYHDIIRRGRAGALQGAPSTLCKCICSLCNVFRATWSC